jgi:arylsulfatase
VISKHNRKVQTMVLRKLIMLHSVLLIAVSIVLFGVSEKAKAQTSGELDRTILPIPHPVPELITEPDVRKAIMPERFDLKAPDGAPNVLVVMIDDMGFGHSNAFGGPIEMPTLERIANEGLRYNRFHTSAVCSASRAALLTGNNSHAVNCGEIADNATGFPGNTFVRPDDITPLAQILRMNGYNTAMYGKSHETPGWEITPSGPFDRWPTGQGFEKFYGFVGGDMNQYSPMLYDGTTLVDVKKDENYHLTTDLANHAISWIGSQHSLTPDHPFFVYFAPGATHAPHHAPKEWSEKYRGQFDMGWDKLREQTFERQKKMGIIPADSKLSPRPKEIPAWDSFSAEEQKLFARQMEVFAGFAAHTDNEIGRIVDYLESIGQLDNTIIIYIAGDNGASAEGGALGTFNEIAALNSTPGTVKEMMALYDEWGGPNTFPHFAMGWALAGNAPFPWVKQIAGHLGGSRVGMAVRYPKAITTKGEIRNQFYHLIDVAPTILEVANIPQPEVVNGIKQKLMDGVSMFSSFSNAEAPENHHTQYFSVFGNRGIYDNGWLASTVRNVPWLMNQKFPPLDEDVWELYDLNTDFSQAVNLAASNPTKLEEMKAIFTREAIKNKVFPIDDRKAERIVPEIAGRPDILKGRKEMNFYEGMEGIFELAIISVKNCEFTVTSDVEVKDDNTNGVIIAQGGRFGGWSIFLKDGKPSYEHNFFGLERYKATSDEKIRAGKHTIVFHFTPDDPKKPGSGGKGILSVDGKQVAEVITPRMVYGVFSFDDGLSIGKDRDTNVSLDYREVDNKFTGKIHKVNIKVK